MAIDFKGRNVIGRKGNCSADKIVVTAHMDAKTGAGYKDGPSALSFYGLPSLIDSKAREVLASSKGVIEGTQWSQGDHCIFIQYGRPALAATSQWFAAHIDSQTITHTPKDKPEIVDCQKLVELAEMLNTLIRKL